MPRVPHDAVWWLKLAGALVPILVAIGWLIRIWIAYSIGAETQAAIAQAVAPVVVKVATVEKEAADALAKEAKAAIDEHRRELAQHTEQAEAKRKEDSARAEARQVAIDAKLNTLIWRTRGGR